MVVVSISTMVLVFVLSAFNGLEGLLRTLYGSFDAQITVLPAAGKSFEYSDELKNQILEIDDISTIVDVIEDNALIMYRGTQRFVKLKGVGDSFSKQNRFQNALTFGNMNLKEDHVGYAIIGRGISNDLSVKLNDDFYPIQVYYPKDIGPGQINPERMFTLKHILPGSVFAVEKYIDDNYIFVPIEFSQELFNYGTRRTALELGMKDGTDLDQVKIALESTLGSDFRVKLGDEIHSDLYKIIKLEKIFVFLALAAIIGIASVNIYFSLSMLVIDKKKDLALLTSIGSPGSLLFRIFMTEGAIIAIVGTFTGIILGLTIAGIQKQFGVIGMGVPGAIVDAYPIIIEWRDILVTSVVIILITMLSAIQPARKAAKSMAPNLLQ